MRNSSGVVSRITKLYYVFVICETTPEESYTLPGENVVKQLVLLLACLLSALVCQAETGCDAWLRYARLDPAACRQHREALPSVVTTLGDAEMVASAREEDAAKPLARALKAHGGLLLYRASVYSHYVEILPTDE